MNSHRDEGNLRHFQKLLGTSITNKPAVQKVLKEGNLSGLSVIVSLENWVFHATNESLNTTSKTDDVVYVG